MAARRIAAVDIAKGIAIVSIVVGHIGLYSASGTELTQPWLYQFHVPVFFVVAGYFLNTRTGVKDFAVSKARRLLLPYLATAGFVVVGTALLQLAGGGSTWPAGFAQAQDALLAALYGSGSWFNPTPLGIAPIGAIWFLPALFCALVIYRICLQWRFGWVAIVALAAASLLSARVFWLPFSLQSACVGALFIMLGRVLRKRDFLERKPDLLVVFVLVCLFIVAGVYNLKISLASLLVAGSALVGLVVGGGASVLVLLVAKIVDDHRATGGEGRREGEGSGAASVGARALDVVARCFEFYGTGSLTVLCVHLAAIDLGLNTVVGVVSGLGGNALSVVLIAVHLGLTGACIPLFRKIPGLRKLWP